MKILLVAHSFPPDAFAGVEIHVYHLARILGERHQVRVLHRVADESAREFTVSHGSYEGVPTIRLVNNLKDRDPVEPDLFPGVRAAFARILDGFDPDVVHFHHLIHLSADLADEAADRGTASVASLHDYWYLCNRVQLYVPGKGSCPGPGLFRCADCFNDDDELLRSMRRFAVFGDRVARFWMNLCTHVDWPEVYALYERRFQRMRNTLSKYDMMIANSNHLRGRYIRFGAPAGRVEVIHPGLDPRELKSFRHSPKAEVRFGYVGSIVEHKGLDVLLDAFSRVPEASLKVWGDDGVNPEVQAYRSTLQPTDNVRFMGGFDPSEIGKVLAGIDVLVVPPIWEEAYGLTLDEAKLAGIPVIASRTGGIPEHLIHGSEGFLFTPGDADELERLVRRLAGRSDLVKKLTPKGDDVAGLYENAEDVEGVYRIALAARRRGQPRGVAHTP